MKLLLSSVFTVWFLFFCVFMSGKHEALHLSKNLCQGINFTLLIILLVIFFVDMFTKKEEEGVHNESGK